MDDSQRLPPSKFGPRPLGPNQLERGRLVSELERHAHAKLVLMQAPAGYGKTTLMAQWYERLTAAGQGTGWVGLDDDDNDAGRLATVLSLALVPEAHGEADLFDAVNKCLQAHSHFTLFLDEEERITEPDAQHLFEVLLKLSPVDFHLVIGSRIQPQKLSTRLLLRSDFLELTARELAFQPDEISQFIRLRCGVALDAQTETYLAQRTEGWAAVLQLAAADIARGVSARTLFDHADSPHRNLFQYLSDEVLIHLRPQQHEFLLQTAFVDELAGPLCDAITGRADGEAMLLELQQSNLLLQAVDSSRRRFRYHALFAEFLQQQLRERHPQQLPILARRASDWCARAGQPESAVEYALLAGDAEHLMACIRICMDRLITRAQFATARRWLRALPRATLQQQPDLLVWNAWVDIWTNDFAAAQESVADLQALSTIRTLPDRDLMGDHMLTALLAILRARYPQADAATEAASQLVHTGDRRMMAAIGNLRALLQQMRGRFAETAQESARVLAIAAQPPANWLSFVHAAHISAMMEMSLGNLAGAWRQLELPERRMADAETQGDVGGNRSQLLALLSGPKAFVLYELNRPEDAEDCLERYEPFLNTIFSPSSRALWHQLRVRLRALGGDEESCQEALRQGSDFAARHRIEWMEVMMQWERVDHDLWRGDLHRARAVAAGLLESTELATPPEWIAPCGELFGPTLIALRCLIRTGEHGRALEYLPIHIEHARQQQRRLRLTALRVLEALALEAADRGALAVEAMQQALLLGAPTGAVRIFLDEGTPCLSLLRRLERAVALDAEQTDYLNRLRAGFAEAEPRAAAPPLPIPLSARELQIIQRLAEGHSNLVVGQQLFLSPNTVKWHLSQIYAKLGVRNRTHAVHVARQHHLTPVAESPRRP
jgi:LuxR family transcriptional regulator, maltose regulon positive regulatory protein